jgi:ankyrin repeat protein
MARRLAIIAPMLLMILNQAWAQTAPTAADEAAYRGLHAAAANGDTADVRRLIAAGANLEARDVAGRTPLHVAAFKSHEGIVRILASAGADINALEGDAYDAVTIAAVADDLDMLRLALGLRGNPKNITSPYDGTALIAAAHLGHVDVVRELIAAGADRSITDRQGVTPLAHARNKGYDAIIAVLEGAAK